jgi:hypothetical protein
MIVALQAVALLQRKEKALSMFLLQFGEKLTPLPQI